MFTYFKRTAFVSLFLFNVNAKAIDWAQPPVACTEEVVPAIPEKGCLDLSGVVNPTVDWPEGIDPLEKEYWIKTKRTLNYCRAAEVLRREENHPGSFTPGTIELNWMRFVAVENSQEKIAAIYEASRKNKVPTQVLTGALFQESLFADLGIAEDGGNYSCGIGQINVEEWCGWTQQLSSQERTALGLAPSQPQCEKISTELVKPFFDIAITRLGDTPDYRLNSSHFRNIRPDDVVGEFPAANRETQNFRFQFTKSFVENCSNPKYGIAAKANALMLLYRNHVPAKLRAHDSYKNGERFQRQCRQPDESGLYPLHTGFMLAVGMYNAGPRSLDALAHYQGWTQNDLASSDTFEGLTPRDLVESFYWSGKYDARYDAIFQRTLGGGSARWDWYRLCVLQRHVARVAQHVTLPGTAAFIDSLEGSNPCAKSVYDRDTGELVRSGVPLIRQQSSGTRSTP